MLRHDCFTRPLSYQRRADVAAQVNSPNSVFFLLQRSSTRTKVFIVAMECWVPLARTTSGNSHPVHPSSHNQRRKQDHGIAHSPPQRHRVFKILAVVRMQLWTGNSRAISIGPKPRPTMVAICCAPTQRTEQDSNVFGMRKVPVTSGASQPKFRKVPTATETSTTPSSSTRSRNAMSSDLTAKIERARDKVRRSEKHRSDRRARPS
jgi:hypothetical protein